MFYALSFYVTITVLVGPKWFWSDQIDLDLTIIRDVVRFSNPGVLAVMWSAYLPPLVGIGLTELPNSGGAKATPAPPLMTALIMIWSGPK